MKPEDTYTVDIKLGPKTIALAILPLLLIALLAVSIFERKYAEPLFIHTTYYFLLVMVMSWIGVYLNSARGLTRAAVVDWAKENIAGIIIALGLTLITALAVHPALRVLSDEANLLGTSKNFFFSKVATFTTTGKYYYDNYWDAGVVIDRRPPLFPFLVSFIHILRGYSYTGPFVLNILVMPIFVLVGYRLAKSLGGETFGVAAALLLAAHPITLISIRSGGFDFFAAFFSLLILKNFLDHCRAPSADRLAVLWMNLCLFVEIRYESGLFLPPVVILLMIFRLVKLEYLRPYRFIYALSPAFLLPRIWQAILRGNVPEQEPGTITFSATNFFTNAKEYFQPIFTPFDYHSPHGAFILGLGVIGCGLILYWTIKRVPPTDRPKADTQFTITVGVWMALQLFIVFTYFWGRSQHPAAARLILAIDTFFSFPAAWALTAMLKRCKPVVTWVTCAGIFAIYLPVAAEYRILNELTLTREAATTWRFFESLHESRILIVTDRPGLYTIMNYGAIDFENAKQDPGVLQGLSRHLFYDIYLIQQIDINSGKPLPQFDIWPERTSTPLLEFQNDINTTVRISRLAH